MCSRQLCSCWHSCPPCSHTSTHAAATIRSASPSSTASQIWSRDLQCRGPVPLEQYATLAIVANCELCPFPDTITDCLKRRAPDPGPCRRVLEDVADAVCGLNFQLLCVLALEGKKIALSLEEDSLVDLGGAAQNTCAGLHPAYCLSERALSIRRGVEHEREGQIRNVVKNPQKQAAIAPGT